MRAAFKKAALKKREVPQKYVGGIKNMQREGRQKKLLMISNGIALNAGHHCNGNLIMTETYYMTSMDYWDML